MENQPLKNLISFTSGSLLASAVVYLLIAAVLGGGLYFLGYKNGQANGVRQGQNQASQEAQAKINATPIGQADQNEVLRISGQIINKSAGTSTAQSLMVSAANLNRNPLSAPTPAERKILISANTKIIKKIRKPADQIAKERYEYTEAVKNNPATVMPSSTMDSLINFNNLKTGQTVKIFADNNIRNQAEFTAVEINIFE